ncbi:MAG: endonuclease III [Holosporales bacterium]|jgi:endonuclease-3|nr:endonuclease III [Holosporales bacterium]
MPARAYEIFERFEINNPHPRSELSARNEFTFVVSVLLSAQATDRSVNNATEGLFKIADEPRQMLALGIDGLKQHIKSIGLYNNKAKNIIELSKLLLSKYDSKVPRTRQELEQLPGIGRKSANVILNHLFGEAYIAVDTHVMRVSKRLGLSHAKSPLAIEADLTRVIPDRFHVNASNWLVLHGRYVCKAASPDCPKCPILDLCPHRQKRGYNGNRRGQAP